MTHPKPDNLDELLSAYVDGEVTAQERALVEQSLESSAEIQHQLAEYTEIREQLQSLTAPPAPLDLRSSVLSAIAATQMPDTTTSSPHQVTAKKPVVKFLLKWVTIAASLAGVGVLTMLSLNNVQSPASKVAEPRNELENSDLMMTKSEAAAAPATVVAPELAMNTADMPADADSVSMLAGKEGWFFGSSELQTQLGEGRIPAIGELLSVLETRGESPVVVTYSVVDTVGALGKAQVLLQRQGIRFLDGQEVKLSNERFSEDTVAIYMEAPEDQLDAALKEIEVEFESPVEQRLSNGPAKVPAEQSVGRRIDRQDPASAEEKTLPPSPAPHTFEVPTGQSVDPPPTEQNASPSFQMVIPLDPSSEDFVEKQVARDAQKKTEARPRQKEPTLGGMAAYGAAGPVKKSAIIIIKQDSE